MKILVETPTKMVIHDKSIYFQVIFGFILLIISLVILLESANGNIILSILYAVFFFICAVISFINIEIAMTEIDKQTGSISIANGPIYRRKIQQLSIQEISAVKLWRSWGWWKLSDKRNFGGVKLSLVTKDNSEFQLNLNLYIFKMPDFYLHIPTNVEKVAEKTSQFLNVPFEKVGRLGSPLY